MYLSIIILPLLGSIVSGFFGRKIGVTGSHFLTCLTVMTTTLLAILSFFEVGFNNNPVSVTLFKWLDSESFNIIWTFQFDSLTVSMLIPVLIISSLVHFYSIGYMSHDPHNQRFFSYLSLFTFMMVILVTGNNYLVMFVGWEGVGVCSYLLVSFWFTRIAANQSSMAAFLTNRVGDCFLTIGMFVLLWTLGNLDYTIVFSLAPYINENVITIIGICLLIGAMAKSSQVGLHIWLPMAMEGPTPVSALIHAATMVTAGVYLLIRSSPLIEYSGTVLLICLWLGAITTVFSSLIGLFQQDIKKIIAYSTMSQLGMMVIAIGLSSYNIAIFHLVNHAFYKGLLFLGAGAVIHAVVDNQDLRKYGGLIKYLPLSYTVILMASLSLVAFPFMTGYYSKDFILESAYGQYNFSSVDVYIIAVIGAIFTTLYSVKILYLTFLANPNGSINYYKNAHEGDIFISLPLVILAIFSVYFGYVTKDIFIGLGSGFFTDNSIFIHPVHEILIDTEFAVPTIFKLIPFILTISFSAIALIYSEFMPNFISSIKLSNLGYYIFGFFNQRFLIELFYNKYVVNGILHLGSQTTKVLDKGSIEWIGPYGLYKILLKISKVVSSLSKGIVTDYALYILLGIALYLILFSFITVFSDIVNSIALTSVILLLNISYYTLENSDKDILFAKFSLTNQFSFFSSLLRNILNFIILIVKGVIFYMSLLVKSFIVWTFSFFVKRKIAIKSANFLGNRLALYILSACICRQLWVLILLPEFLLVFLDSEDEEDKGKGKQKAEYTKPLNENKNNNLESSHQSLNDEEFWLKRKANELEKYIAMMDKMSKIQFFETEEDQEKAEQIKKEKGIVPETNPREIEDKNEIFSKIVTMTQEKAELDKKINEMESSLKGNTEETNPSRIDKRSIEDNYSTKEDNPKKNKS